MHDEALTRIPVIFHDASESLLVALKYDWCEFVVQLGFPGYDVNGGLSGFHAVFMHLMP